MAMTLVMIVVLLAVRDRGEGGTEPLKAAPEQFTRSSTQQHNNDNL